MNPAAVIGAAVALTVILARPVPVQPEAIPVDPAIPLAIRVDPPSEPVAPDWSRCPQWYGAALDAGWTAEDWPTLDVILWRESRCNPAAINRRSGTRGLTQITRGNLRRLGVSYTDALDPDVNLTVARQLCQEWLNVGRSCYRPWWLKRWRP